MERAEAVREARMLGSLVIVKPDSKLLDSPQTLKLRRVNQTDHQLTFCRIVAQRNDVVDWVAIDSLGQVSAPRFGIKGGRSLSHGSKLIGRNSTNYGD